VTPARPRVLLVDDHDLFRAGARSELGDAIEVVGEADEVAAAIELIVERLPDVVLLDVHMPDGEARRSSKRSSGTIPRSSSWHCRSPTLPRT